MTHLPQSFGNTPDEPVFYCPKRHLQERDIVNPLRAGKVPMSGDVVVAGWEPVRGLLYQVVGEDKCFAISILRRIYS